MYIIELIYKLKEKKLKLNENKALEDNNEQNDDSEKCEHIFAPVDSTGTVLGCKKCGFLIHVNPDEFKKKNFFRE